MNTGAGKNDRARCLGSGLMFRSFRSGLRLAGIGVAYLLVLSGCAADEPPDLSEARKFGAYRVYYAGEDVAGRPITEILGGNENEKPRDGVWFFIYGNCESPSGVCAPFQIHNYSTCTRWVGLPDESDSLRDFRGAKARFIGFNEGVEIFTGRTTISVSGDPVMLRAALRQLRDVRESKPSRLPPPAPGSLEGNLPCQRPAQRRRAEHRLTPEEIEHQLRVFRDHYAGVNCGMRADDHFACMATYFGPTPPTKVEIDIKASAKPFRFFATDCRVVDPEPDTEFACEALTLGLNMAMTGPGPKGPAPASGTARR